ncbi:hypothetical protein BGZ76_004526 [Entomortierella beljakovae]|nr:hypothetical protein BGZ76_004526 [Entomortierella beljakovae]
MKLSFALLAGSFFVLQTCNAMEVYVHSFCWSYDHGGFPDTESMKMDITAKGTRSSVSDFFNYGTKHQFCSENGHFCVKAITSGCEQSDFKIEFMESGNVQQVDFGQPATCVEWPKDRECKTCNNKQWLFCTSGPFTFNTYWN